MKGSIFEQVIDNNSHSSFKDFGRHQDFQMALALFYDKVIKTIVSRYDGAKEEGIDREDSKENIPYAFAFASEKFVARGILRGMVHIYGINDAVEGAEYITQNMKFFPSFTFSTPVEEGDDLKYRYIKLVEQKGWKYNPQTSAFIFINKTEGNPDSIENKLH